MWRCSSGGNTETIVPLLIMTLKSRSCVSCIDHGILGARSGPPGERACSGLAVGQLSFSISFAYRILPVLMEEFQNILLSYRLRGNPPSKNGLAGKIRYLAYQIRMIIQAFYSADAQYGEAFQNDRGSVGTQGYRHSIQNPEVKKMKLAMLKVTRGGPHFCMHFHCLCMRKLRRFGSAVDPGRCAETGIRFFYRKDE